MPNVIINNIDEEKNKKLVYIFNQIKEEFVTARHLYYQSFSQDQEMIEVSNITEYVDTLDSAYFGLKGGLLKTSLRLSVDLLDKCAGFLYEYFYDNLDLKTPKKLNDISTVYLYYKNSLTFNNFWYIDFRRRVNKDTKQENLHPIIDKKLENNPYLRALYNMKKDLYIESEYEKPFHKPFDDKDHFYPFRILRNYLTHQGITLHQNEVIDESKVNYSLEQMQEETYFLLRMVKAAIIYLVGVVMIEEKEKNTKA